MFRTQTCGLLPLYKFADEEITNRIVKKGKLGFANHLISAGNKGPAVTPNSSVTTFLTEKMPNDYEETFVETE